MIFFGVFSFSEESKLTKEKTKNEENYLHGKTPNKQKKKWEIFLGFLLILTELKRKTEKKQEVFLDFLKVFQTHKKKTRKINLAWIIQWKSVDTDNWNEMCKHEYNVGGYT